MSPLMGLLALLCGIAIGWSLRAEKLWELQRRNDELLDDLDTAVRDIAAMIGKQNHPASRARTLTAVPTRAQQ